ncbi:MAG TPA: TonB-dependent receptor, partial [Steroidobacteraceae bacterium]|nr:TonB-dependent receptor [Steroidobacteraceae bacterium]
LRGGIAFGSFDAFRASANANGKVGAFGYNADYAYFSIDGFRDHSSARNQSFNSKLDYAINDANKLTLVTTVISRPDSQDPLGITAAQFAANPEQTDAAATTFNTRKSLQQEQAGLIYDLKVTDAQSVRLLGYYGRRKVTQFLSITTGAQVAATSAGGVVDLDREFAGGEARWAWQSTLAGKPFSLVAGATYDRQNEHRRGYNDFVGAGASQVLGVQGVLRRDENNIGDDTAEYVQATWEFAEQWSAMAGLRHSEEQFDSQDHYIVTGNGDDSGTVSYSATLPVAGVMFKPQPWVHLFASYGQGIQTPIGAELAYQPSGAAGLNFALKAARNNNEELGAKLHIGGAVAEAVLFQALTNNEIVIFANTGGRATYQNAGRTKRQGVELSLNYALDNLWRLQFAYTYLDATYSDAFTTCTATPCTVAQKVPVAADNRLPGIPKNNAYVAVRFGHEDGWFVSLNAQYLSDVFANDPNTAAALADSYTLVGLNGGYALELGAIKLNAFLRVNNIFDKDYVGSVIVNDSNGRFFEPGPPRSVLGGINIAWK